MALEMKEKAKGQVMQVPLEARKGKNAAETS